LLIAFLIATVGSANWYDGARLEVRFLKPVQVGDSVQPKLRWLAREDVQGNVLLTAECWCELANGERVVAGSAWCRVSVRPVACEASPK
jgi:acyl dehydratase